MQEKMITVQYSDLEQEDFERKDISTILRQEHIVLKYAKGEWSAGKCAEILRIPYSQFLTLLGAYGIPLTDETKEESDRIVEILIQGRRNG
jgi:predicted HTH domain antitoxin